MTKRFLTYAFDSRAVCLPIFSDFNWLFYRHACWGCLLQQIPQRTLYHDAHVCSVFPPNNHAWTCSWRPFLQTATHSLQGLQSTWLGNLKGALWMGSWCLLKTSLGKCNEWYALRVDSYVVCRWTLGTQRSPMVPFGAMGTKNVFKTFLQRNSCPN